MSDQERAITRPAQAEMADDIVLPFTVDALDVRGRVARLGEAVDAAIRQHDYPAPVSRLLAEMMALTALVGSSLKFEGRLIVQAETDGPVRLVVADFATPRYIRGLARFDAAAVTRAEEEEGAGDALSRRLLGSGRLVFTIDQGEHMQRYQGMVALSGSLQEAVETYFASSEQIPTRVKLAAGQITDDGRRWRAGAMMIQHMPPPASDASSAGAEADASGRAEEDSGHWQEAVALFDTIEDHELLDPSLSPERLLYRLFHQQGVRVFEPQPVEWRCTCSRERIEAMLKAMDESERRKLVENGRITVTCEFCSARYDFDPDAPGAG
jgi:molecular chaperone Hsp33